MSESTIKQYVYRRGARRRIPVSGIFELTPRCNLNCKMCYIHVSAEEQRQLGAELTTEQWLDIGRQAVKAGMIYLLLTGGEPMLRPDFPVIYTEMVKMGVRVSINTNATLVTPEIVDCLAKHPPEVVNVTLYGASPETYEALCGVRAGYERTCRGIRMMQEAGIRLNINTTFTACNAQDMEALVAYADANRLPIRTTSYTFPPVRNGHPACTVCLSPEEQGRLNARFEFVTSTAEQRARKEQYLRRCIEQDGATPIPTDDLPAKGRPSGCMAGRGSFWVSWHGEMYPCGMLSAYAVKPTEGSHDFAAMWAQVRELTEAIYLPAACENCAYRKICPSCAAVCHSNHGDTTAKVEEMCRYIKTYAHTFLSLMETVGSEVPPKIANDDQPTDPFTCL